MWQAASFFALESVKKLFPTNSCDQWLFQVSIVLLHDLPLKLLTHDSSHLSCNAESVVLLRKQDAIRILLLSGNMAVNTHRPKPETTSTDRTVEDALATAPPHPSSRHLVTGEVETIADGEVMREISFPGSHTKFLIPCMHGMNKKQCATARMPG